MVKNNKQQGVQQRKNNSNMEQELSLNQEAMDVLIATKAGGTITKKLVELGERALIEDSSNKK